MMLKAYNNKMHIANTKSTHDIYPQSKEFTTKDNILFKIIQDVDKPFQAILIPTFLALTILVNSHNLQGYAGTNKYTS